MFRTKVTTIFACILLAGCASTGRSLDLDALAPAREVGHTAPGRWTFEEGVLTSVLDPNASPDAIRVGADGAGVALGLIEEFEAVDLDIEAEAMFEGGAAAGLLFHVDERDGVIVSAMFLAMNTDGLFMWRLEDGVWTRVGQHRIGIAPMTRNTIAVKVRGESIRVFLNNVRVLSGTHAGANGSRAGIGARAGVGHFYNLRARSWD